MKCSIPEISWHNREPVLSLAIHPTCDQFYRLATGGADTHVLIWQVNIGENGSVKVEALSDLTRHQKAVNAVRWSPSGQYLASGDDDANIIVWELKTDNIPLLEGETTDKETWIVKKVMRGHKEDIYDLCWSPNGAKILSGSIDNTAILWDFAKGKNEAILTDHKGFVQGVAWDPKGHYFSTISTDRVCRIYDHSGKQVRARILKGSLPVPDLHYLYQKDVKFFHDDTFKSFFRRLDFSPDGTLLAVPSGHVQIDDSKKVLNATYLFAVDSWSSPVAILPCGLQCSTVSKFCPILFQHHDNGPDPIISLPFRMILAVGTDHDVILYDTQQMQPFAYFHNIHYTRVTDLTWSTDGLLLVASSTDGFCALITFEPEELGMEYTKEESEAEESQLNISGCEEITDPQDLPPEEVKPAKKTILEQWALNSTPKKRIAPTPVFEVKIAPQAVDTPCVQKHRRIQPTLVKTNSETPKAESTKKNVNSPLMKFLKKATPRSGTAKKKVASPSDPAVILDEVEAQDAWSCAKVDDEPIILVTDDIDKDTQNTETKDDFVLHLDDSTITEIKENSKVPDVVATAETRPDDKNKPLVKKRAPLITLSSPKQKKMAKK